MSSTQAVQKLGFKNMIFFIFTVSHKHHIKGHPFLTSTRRRRGQAQMDACGRGRGSASCRLKLEIIILSSFLAKKLAFSIPAFCQNKKNNRIKNGNFSQYKLVI